MAYSWTNDPMVRIEENLNPFLVGTALALAEDGFDRQSICKRCNDIIDLFDHEGTEMVVSFGFTFSEDERQAIQHALRCTKTFQEPCGRATTCREDLLRQFSDDLLPAANDALNAYRAVFIGGIIQVQVNQTQSARQAVEELSRISRQIQFVSVNASIEAARLGEAGHGFAVIGTEMRRLAHTATERTKRLRGVIDGGPSVQLELIQTE